MSFSQKDYSYTFLFAKKDWFLWEHTEYGKKHGRKEKRAWEVEKNDRKSREKGQTKKQRRVRIRER